MKTFVFLVILTCTLGSQTQAQTFNRIRVVITTGGDDLRGGNHAFLFLNFNNNTISPVVCLTTAPSTGGFSNGSIYSATFAFEDEMELSDVKGFTIRHQGNPRSDHPFDTYDNWDMEAIRVSAITADSGVRGVNIYNSRNDRSRWTFVERFTGENTTLELLKQ